MRLLVVDDHEVVRRGVRSLLSISHDVCGEAADGQEALQKAQQLNPDVIVMDISMPTLNGLEATRLIRAVLPGAEVLIMSQHDSPAMVREAFKAGARGYVVKSAMGKDLLDALEKVARHETFLNALEAGSTAHSGQIGATESREGRSASNPISQFADRLT